MSQDFSTTITVNNTPEEVFNAINNVRGWWSEETEGHPDRLNEEWNYHYQDVHRCTIKTTELVPYSRIVWLITDNYFSFTEDKDEWKGNSIVFEITEQDGKTQLLFTHHGLVPEYGCYDICQNAWNTYIQKSLYSLITTGSGQPNGKDKPQTEDEKELTGGYTTTFFADQSPGEVFDAVNNVRGWWQGTIEGSTDKLNDEFTYRMEDVHFSKQKITTLIPEKKVVWLVTDSELSFTKEKTEWTGTKIVFDIEAINNKTQLRFTHSGLVPKLECYGDCSNAWEQLIGQSLFSLVTTGRGTKVF